MKALAAVVAIAVLLAGIAQTEAAEPAPQVFSRLGGWQLYGDSPNYLDLGIGAFNLRDVGDGGISGAARIELRFGKKLFFLGPAIGLMANLDGGFFGYGGLYADVAYKRLVITPLAAAGGYIQGESKDLGGTFQFRLALGLSYQFDNFFRLGINVAHISNAEIQKYNPGEEEIYLTFALPF